MMKSIRGASGSLELVPRDFAMKVGNVVTEIFNRSSPRAEALLLGSVPAE